MGEEGGAGSIGTLHSSVVASRSGSMDVVRLPGTIVTLPTPQRTGGTTPTRRPTGGSSTTPSAVVPVMQTLSSGPPVIDDSVSHGVPMSPLHIALEGGVQGPAASSSDYGGSVHSVGDDSDDSEGYSRLRFFKNVVPRL